MDDAATVGNTNQTFVEVVTVRLGLECEGVEEFENPDGEAGSRSLECRRPPVGA